MTTESIKEKIELSRTELLDLSLRNPLLNYKLLTAKGVEAVGTNPVEVFGALVRDGASMRFLDTESKSTARNRLRTEETAEWLERRLLKTYTDARTLIEEQGVNTLFIALGMVHWYEADSSDLERKAPLILLPVRLERANVNAGFTLRYSGEDTGANIVFIQKAKNDFNIDIPELPEDEENDAEDIDVAAYFSAVARSIKRMKRWIVDRESVVLGFFSFNKLLMYRDLDADMWPEDSAPSENDIIRALFEDGFREAESAIGEDDHLDDHLKPEDAHHVVDADSSQAKAIYDVNNGRNLIIQGPPGTGKSQTITNIIAEGVAQDKTILFVAEKMAALEVVKRRLDSIGVGVACLELHSHKTQKKAVIDELRKTLELGEPSIEGIDDDFVALEQRQDSLNDYAEAVNLSVGDTSITPYRAFGELIRIKAQQNDKPLRSLRVRGIDSWSNADFQRKFGIVSELQTILQSVGIPQKHTFRGAQLRVATPLTEADISDGIESALESLETLSEASGHLCGALGLDTPEDTAQVEAILPLAEHAAKAPNIKDVSLRDLEQHTNRDKIIELLELRERWERLHSEFDDTLKAEAWNADVSEAHRVLSTTEHSCWRSLISSRYRCARNQLATLFRTTPPGDVESLNALGKLVELLGNALGLQEPETIAQLKDLLAIAEYAAEAPNIKDVSLRDLEQHANRDKINELLELRERWERLHSEFDDTLKAEAWSADVSEAHRVLSTTERNCWRSLISPRYRFARNQLATLFRTTPPGDVKSLNALGKLAKLLGNALGLREPETIAQLKDLLVIAEYAARAPSINGVSLRGLEQAADRDRINELLELRERWERLHSGFDDTLKPEAWNADVSEAHRVLSTTGRSFFGRLVSPAYRRARNEIMALSQAEPTREVERQITLAKSILEEQQTRRDIENLSVFAETVLGQWWRGEHSDWKTIRRIVEWALNLLEDVDRGKVNSALVFTMSDEFDANMVNELHTRTRNALENHRIIVEIECSDAKIERQITLAKSILEEQQTRRDIENLSVFAETVLGQWRRGEHSDWKTIRRIVEWALNLLEDVDRGKVNSALVFAMSDEFDASGVQDALKRTQSAVKNHGERLADIENTLELDNSLQFGNTSGLHAMPYETQKDVLAKWETNVGGIRDMARFNSFVDNAKNEDLDAVVKLIWNWEEAATLLAARFENARYNAILSRAIKERPSLASFDVSVHSQRIREFREMDELALVHNRARVAHIHWDALPQYDGGGQLGILRREFAKKRRHLSVRELVDQAGNAIQAIKPVFMMSPLSVAKYLKPGAIDFDLAVFDEASQVRPVDSLGALLRSKQVVVVGDDKQLPPTNFFNAAIKGDEEDDVDSATADMESILGLFSASGAPNRMLRWHYRSRHESLIAVSNSEFYENRLVVFPSPDSEKRDLGLQYHWVDTGYEGRGRNREEAAHVARAAMEHARLHPELSLGVATFSSGQRDAVQDELEALRHQTDAYEAFFNSHSEEPFFIKNLENVQGDERDVIFISVGYGRNAEGRVYQNFGPLNRDGGERRLNVLISRAKLRCHVFTNLHSDDIVLTANSKGGVQAMKKFLAFAERGEIPDMPIVSGREARSPFQKAVADRLRLQGYEVHDEVASSGYFVDIGMVDPKRPGRYVLGIECDGATYHNSRSARERDRLRESVLVGLGWRIHRIWSSDWFNNPEQELKRAVEAIEDALASQPSVRVSQNGGKSHIQPTDARSKATTEATASTPAIQRADAEQGSRKLVIPPYELKYPVVYTGYSDDLGNTPISYLLEPLIEIVDTEGPVHQDEVFRRITNAAGLRRVGNRIRQNLRWAIDDAVRRKNVRRKGAFLWSPDMERPIVRDRTALEAQQKKIEYIAPEEIAEAILMAVEHSYGIGREEAISDAANLLGLRRVTKDVGDKIGTAVDSLLKDERIKESGGHLTLQ